MITWSPNDSAGRSGSISIRFDCRFSEIRRIIGMRSMAVEADGPKAIKIGVSAIESTAAARNAW